MEILATILAVLGISVVVAFLVEGLRWLIRRAESASWWRC